MVRGHWGEGKARDGMERTPRHRRTGQGKAGQGKRLRDLPDTTWDWPGGTGGMNAVASFNDESTRVLRLPRDLSRSD